MNTRNDPIVDEIRRARQTHTDRHGADLHAICEDLRRQEQESGKQFVSLAPRRLEPVASATNSNSE